MRSPHDPRTDNPPFIQSRRRLLDIRNILASPQKDAVESSLIAAHAVRLPWKLQVRTTPEPRILVTQPSTPYQANTINLKSTTTTWKSWRLRLC